MSAATEQRFNRNTNPAGEMKMKTTQALLIAAMLAACCSAMAANNGPTNTYPKEHTVGAPGSCHETRAGDTRLTWGPLVLTNHSAEAVDVVCSRDVDVSTNGTARVGVVITNGQANNRSVTCKASISSGGNGPKDVSKSVLVGPLTAQRIEWTAADMGQRLLVGGQVGFTCTLPPKMGVTWIWAVPVN